MAAGMFFYSRSTPQSGVIEVIGRPGAGKTFMCQALVRSGWKLDPRSGGAGRRWLTPLTLLICPNVSLLLAAIAATRRPLAPWRFRGALRFIRKYDQIHRMRHRGLYVIDEGPVHTLIDVLFNSSSTAVSKWFMRRALRRVSRVLTLCIYLDVPNEDCVRNAWARNEPQSWFHSKMSVEAARQLRDDTTYDEIVDTLEAVAPGKVRRFASSLEAKHFLDEFGKVRRTATVKTPGEPGGIRS